MLIHYCVFHIGIPSKSRYRFQEAEGIGDRIYENLPHFASLVYPTALRKLQPVGTLKTVSVLAWSNKTERITAYSIQ